MSLMFRRLLAQVATAIAVEPASVTIEPADTFQLTGTVFDANGAPVVGAVIAWASDDTGVATVDSSGLVTGVADGVCTITATSGALSDTCEVTVQSTDPHFANVIFLLDGTQPGILS